MSAWRRFSRSCILPLRDGTISIVFWYVISSFKNAVSNLSCLGCTAVSCKQI